MPTLRELRDQAKNLEFQRLVFTHLIDYIDKTFRPLGEREPSKKILNDEHLPVPDAVFESVSSMMAQQVIYLGQQVEAILNAPVALQAPPEQASDADPMKTEMAKQEQGENE